MIIQLNKEMPLRDIGFDGTWTVAYLGNYRLYWQVNDGGNNGFTAYLVSWCSCHGSYEDIWQNANVEVIMQAHCLFDGIRHFHMPYWHYVDLKVFTEVVKHLTRLQGEHCHPDNL